MVVCCEIVGRGSCIQLSLVLVLLLVLISPLYIIVKGIPGVFATLPEKNKPYHINLPGNS